MDTAILKSYSEEASIIAAGWHDGESVRVAYAHSMDPLVNAHERIHNDIFMQNPDGQMLSFLLFAEKQAARGALDSGIAASYATLAKTLFECSEFAQEVFATYLSVKVQPWEEHAQHLARYPKSYREYYDQLAVVLDPFLGSSYLQYLVAWNMAVVAFSSPFPGRFLSQLPQVPTSLEPGEMPNHRLSLMMEALKDEGTRISLLAELQAIANRQGSSRGYEPWDLQSEEGWSESPDGAARELEFALSDHLRNWLPNAAQLEFCDPTSETVAMYTQFARSLGLNLTMKPAFRSSAEIEGRMMFDAISASKSTIANFPLPTPQGDRYLMEHLTPDHAIAVERTSVEHSKIDVVAWPDAAEYTGAEALFARIEDETLESITWRREPMDIRPYIQAIVLGLHETEDMKKWYYRLHQLILPTDHHAVLRAAGFIKFRLFWYLHGNYVSWLDTLSHPIFCASLVVKSAAMAHGGGVIKVLRTGGDDGDFFIRVFSEEAASQLHDYEEHLIKNGTLIREDDSKLHRDTIVAAYNLCSMMWPEL